MDITRIIIYAVAGAAILAFVLLAYKDVLLLFRRPATLGTGFGRIWAVGRTTMFEAWAAKAWAVPIIWFVACCTINLLSRAYDDTERISLYLHVLLGGQTFLCLILLGVMACYSFPRERERRTIITTAAKPLSRLEYFLGKIVGFCAVALLLLASMALLTWVFMLGTNEYVKSVAQANLAHEQKEFDAGERGSEPPSEALRLAAREGELHAYDFVAPASLQVAGGADYTKDPPELYVKGGSQQKMMYTLGIPSSSARSRTGLMGLPASVSRTSKTPFFFFSFGWGMVPGSVFKEKPQITVHIQLADAPTVSEERTIALAGDPANAQGTYANWAVEDPTRFFWYNVPDAIDPGPILMYITCNTPGVYLRVYAGDNPNEKNVKVIDLDEERIPGAVWAGEAAPALRGFEKGDTEEIEGPKLGDQKLPPSMRPSPEVASYLFRDVKLGDVPVDEKGNFTVSLVLDEDRANDKSGTLGEVRAYPALTPDNSVVQQIVVDQKRATEIKLPATLLDKKGTDLIVDISCLTPKHWIGVPPDGVRLDKRPSFFLLNLLKSELVIFCQCALIILIGVTCSLRLGWPVAMLLTGVCYLLGNLFEWVSGLLHEGGYDVLSFAEVKVLKGSFIYNLGTSLMNASVHMLYFCVNALPDFTRFQPAKYIVDSRSMPWPDLLAALASCGLYAIPFIAIGYLLIRRQELA